MNKHEITKNEKQIFRNTYYLSLIIKKIIRGEDIKYKPLKEAFNLILKNEVKERDLHFGAFFAALKTKGSTEEEISALVDAALELDNFKNKEKLKLSVPEKVYNIVGSGKDDIKTFNVSTATAFLASAGGLKIAKSLSYATSGLTGGRDVLEEVGVNLNITPLKMVKALEKYGVAFFAIENQIPKFDKVYGGKFFFIHPLSYVLPALISPIKVNNILYGIADINTELSAKLLRKYNFDNSAVVCGMNKDQNKYIDEISIIGPTKITELRNQHIKTYTFNPEQIELKLAREKDIVSESREESILAFLRVLSGLDNGPKSEMVCLNSGMLFYISGECDSIEEGYLLSNELIESRKVIYKLQELIEFTHGDKKKFKAWMKRLYE